MRSCGVELPPAIRMEHEESVPYTVGGLCEAADPGFEGAGRRRTGLTELGYKNGDVDQNVEVWTLCDVLPSSAAFWDSLEEVGQAVQFFEELSGQVADVPGDATGPDAGLLRGVDGEDGGPLVHNEVGRQPWEGLGPPAGLGSSRRKRYRAFPDGPTEGSRPRRRSKRMGISIRIVNAARRQFLDPDQFPEHDGRTCFLTGVHAAAVAVLACDPAEVPGHGYGSLAGSWCGDAIIAATDAMRPDCHGIRTSTVERPLRNLYDVAGEEYEDLSLRAFAMVCDGQLALAEGLAGLAREEPGLFMKLGKVAMTVECESLEDALVEVFGRDWTGFYRDLRRLDGVGDDYVRQLDLLRESYGKRWPWRAG